MTLSKGAKIVWWLQLWNGVLVVELHSFKSKLPLSCVTAKQRQHAAVAAIIIATIAGAKSIKFQHLLRPNIFAVY